MPTPQEMPREVWLKHLEKLSVGMEEEITRQQRLRLELRGILNFPWPNIDAMRQALEHFAEKV